MIPKMCPAGVVFFSYTSRTRPIRSVTNESILSAFSGSGRRKTSFQLKSNIFFLAPPARPGKLCHQIRGITATTEINFARRCSVCYTYNTIYKGDNMIFFFYIAAVNESSVRDNCIHNDDDGAEINPRRSSVTAIYTRRLFIF